MRFLKNRDVHFDLCRSLLILWMVVDHTFRNFYIHGYNPHLTVTNLIGFVYLAGITSTAVNVHKVEAPNFDLALSIAIRAVKLIGLFLFCNFLVMFVYPLRLEKLFDLSFLEIFLSILLGTRQYLFAFDVLVPISFVMLFSIFFIFFSKKLMLNIIFAVISLFLLLSLELSNFANFYGFKLVLSGIVGCCTGRILVLFDWQTIVDKACKTSTLFTVLIIAIVYFIISIPILGYDRVYFSKMIIFALLLILIIYTFSVYFRLHDFYFIKVFSDLISNFMLFAYIFHVFIINILLFFLRSKNFDIFITIFLTSMIFLLTFFTCVGVRQARKNYTIIKKTYDFVFK